MLGTSRLWRSCDPSNHSHHRILFGVHITHGVLLAIVGAFTCTCAVIGGALGYDDCEISESCVHFWMVDVGLYGGFLVLCDCIHLVYHGGMVYLLLLLFDLRSSDHRVSSRDYRPFCTLSVCTGSKETASTLRVEVMCVLFQIP